MKLTRLETYTTSEVGLVRALTESGDFGWGQLSPYNADISAAVFHRQVAPWVLGRSVDDLEALFDQVVEAEFKFPGSYLRRAFAGLDTAVWDLRGRVAGKPVAELLGGGLRSLGVYASSMRRSITPVEEAGRLAQLQQDQGYRAVKVRVGKENGHDVDEWPGRSEEMLATIPGALDPDTRLMVDANCGYSPRKAIELGRRLEQNGFVHFEEPCPYWEYEQTAGVRAALDGSPVEVAGGEQDWDLATWRRLLDQPVFDIAQPDLLYLGGLAATRRVVTLARSAEVPILMHSANLALGIVFTLHFVSALAGDLVEWSIEGPDYYPWQYGLYEPMPEVVDGRVTAPGGPGWGVEINDHWLGAADRRVSEE